MTKPNSHLVNSYSGFDGLACFCNTCMCCNNVFHWWTMWLAHSSPWKKSIFQAQRPSCSPAGSKQLVFKWGGEAGAILPCADLPEFTHVAKDQLRHLGENMKSAVVSMSHAMANGLAADEAALNNIMVSHCKTGPCTPTDSFPDLHVLQALGDL